MTTELAVWIPQHACCNLQRMTQPIITSATDIMGGAPVFAGTRVLVQTLLDYFEAGDGIDEFLAGFPSVKRSQVIAFLVEWHPASYDY